MITLLTQAQQPAQNQTPSKGIFNPVLQPGYGGQAGDAPNQALAKYVVLFWRTLVVLGGLAVLLFFVWGAIEWITAGGDSGKIEGARNKIVGAIVGLVILVSSFAILQFLGSLIGFDLLKLTFPTP